MKELGTQGVVIDELLLINRYLFVFTSVYDDV
jgi:hypothetical protein